MGPLGGPLAIGGPLGTPRGRFIGGVGIAIGFSSCLLCGGSSITTFYCYFTSSFSLY